MATVVVSGRVEEDVKQRADVVIRAAGSSVAKVISDVWQNIVATGQLPAATPKAEQDDRKEALESFLHWFEELPPQNEEYALMTDEEILSQRAEQRADEHV